MSAQKATVTYTCTSCEATMDPHNPRCKCTARKERKQMEDEVTFEKVINVARGYRAMMQSELDGPSTDHLIEMVSEMETWGPERGEKAMRWLGFIQGSLWVLGWYDIAEMKEHNRTGDVK